MLMPQQKPFLSWGPIRHCLVWFARVFLLFFFFCSLVSASLFESHGITGSTRVLILQAGWHLQQMDEIIIAPLIPHSALQSWTAATTRHADICRSRLHAPSVCHLFGNTHLYTFGYLGSSSHFPTTSVKSCSSDPNFLLDTATWTHPAFASLPRSSIRGAHFIPSRGDNAKKVGGEGSILVIC